jgi:murein DD-endopeptidase MepM/ murein hydrolase activator NlpD
MKKLLTISFFLFSMVQTPLMFGQNTEITSTEVGGGFNVENDENSNLSLLQYAELEKRCADNAKLFGLENINTKTAVTFIWPLKAAAGLNDCSFYCIGAYADHNPTAGVYLDYNGGSVTYDGHKGTDIFPYPFPEYKMDNNQVEIVAAAAGTIIDKHDGEFDKNCLGVGSNVPANYVIVRHSDGSHALYWHMKSGKVTTKAIGQSVVVGEYLGIVGSSGSSSGPHLHFEAWSGNTSSTVIDPFAGPSNTWNASSWWSSQKPYRETGILKASVHTTDVVTPACPATETLNESISFVIPFQGSGMTLGYAKFYIFLRFETIGMPVNMSILKPNGTVFNSWTHNCTTNYNASYWGYSIKLPTLGGTYTFKATYNGQTCTQNFDILTTNGIDETNIQSNIRVYPNPTNGKIVIESKNNQSIKGTVDIFNLIGGLVFSSKITGSKLMLTLNVAPGIYFYRIKEESNKILLGKLMIE